MNSLDQEMLDFLKILPEKLRQMLGWSYLNPTCREMVDRKADLQEKGDSDQDTRTVVTSNPVDSGSSTG